MKKTATVVLSFLAALAGVAIARGDHHPREDAPASPPVALSDERRALAAAVAAHDIDSIVALSSFPLAIDEYQQKPHVSEKEFRRKRGRWFVDIFADAQSSTVKCIRNGKLERLAPGKQLGGGSWLVDCDGSDYYFGQRNGKWLLVAFANINE